MTEANESEKLVRPGVLAPLLDFYSDRAEAQASFVVASIFGTFGLLAVVPHISSLILEILSIIPYITFWLLGYHCLKRFGYYAGMAETVRWYIVERHIEYDKVFVDMTLEGKKTRVSFLERHAELSDKYPRKDIVHWIINKPFVLKASLVTIFVILLLAAYWQTFGRLFCS